MNRVERNEDIMKPCVMMGNDLFQFYHFNQDAPAGLWKKENVIMRTCIKINVFVEGSFSVFSDGELHQPAYGDICFLPPMKMHYGQILEPMHINYYQLDILPNAFSFIPDGDLLLARLLELTTNHNSFLRPDEQSREMVLQLCNAIESANQRQERFLEWAKIIEFLSMLYQLYVRPTGIASVPHSMRTAQTLRYIESHYAKDVTMKQISVELGVSTSFLSRIFKKEIGISIHEYLNQYRILKAIEFLENHSVTETGYLCGFCDNSHFISVFKKHTGTTPMRYRNMQLGKR